MYVGLRLVAPLCHSLSDTTEHGVVASSEWTKNSIGRILKVPIHILNINLRPDPFVGTVVKDG